MWRNTMVALAPIFGQFLTPTNDGNLILIGHVNSGDGQVTGYHGQRLGIQNFPGRFYHLEHMPGGN